MPAALQACTVVMMTVRMNTARNHEHKLIRKQYLYFVEY